MTVEVCYVRFLEWDEYVHPGLLSDSFDLHLQRQNSVSLEYVHDLFHVHVRNLWCCHAEYCNHK